MGASRPRRRSRCARQTRDPRLRETRSEPSPRETRSSWARTAALGGLVLLLTTQACAPSLPPPPALPEPPPATPETRERVPIRLTALEGAAEVRIHLGAQLGDAVFHRSGGAVVDAAGRGAAYRELRPTSDTGVLSIGDAHYTGSLRVEIHPGGGLRVTNWVPLEDYVHGVVASELVIWSAPTAELEAQAIAARSYALLSLQAAGPAGALRDDTSNQVYRGTVEASANREVMRAQRRLREAVQRTRGRVLTRNGKLLDARFHASCGGATANFLEVFPGQGNPQLTSVPCEPCTRIHGEEVGGGAGSPAWRGQVAWRFTASKSELAQLAAKLDLGDRLLSLRPQRRDGQGRWLELELRGPQGTRRLSMEAFRRHLGPGRLLSAQIVDTWPHLGDPIPSGMLFLGRGRGHGVGLCQVGAHALAEEGWSVEEILDHYFPGATLVSTRPPGTPAR